MHRCTSQSSGLPPHPGSDVAVGVAIPVIVSDALQRLVTGITVDRLIEANRVVSGLMIDRLVVVRGARSGSRGTLAPRVGHSSIKQLRVPTENISGHGEQ